MRALMILLMSAWPALAFAAGDAVVATLEDPAGDDHGAGALAYPQSAAFARGDLDLIALRIVRAADGYRFEATFRNPVRDPAAVAGAAGPEPLAYFARRGFYAFNVDLYLDLDRVRGSGNTWTLPGRGGARIDAAHAWDRAVILTPRPEFMRGQLIDALAHDEDIAAGEAARRIDGLLLFATDIRVRGRTVSFGAPAAFLAGGQPDSGWSVTALVTGAIVAAAAADLAATGDEPRLERLALGAMQPQPGQPRDTLGHAGRSAPLPIVDLLAPAPLSQRDALAAGAALRGVTWSATGATGVAGEAAPVTSLRSPPAAQAAPAAPAESTPSRDIAARLRRLEELRAQGLLTDEEYREQRGRILGEL